MSTNVAKLTPAQLKAMAPEINNLINNVPIVSQQGREFQYQQLYGNKKYIESDITWKALLLDLKNAILEYKQDNSKTSVYNLFLTYFNEIFNEANVIINDNWQTWFTTADKLPWGKQWQSWCLDLPEICIYYLSVLKKEEQNNGYDASIFLRNFIGRSKLVPGTTNIVTGPLIDTSAYLIQSGINTCLLGVLGEIYFIINSNLTQSIPNFHDLGEEGIDWFYQLNPQLLRLFSSNLVAVDSENYKDPLDRVYNFNGVYEDGTIISRGNFFSLQGVQYLFDNSDLIKKFVEANEYNMEVYKQVVAKIYHPQMTIGPYFLGNTNTSLYSSPLQNIYPELIDNYGFELMPMSGGIFCKTPQSYFFMRVQKTKIPAFELDNVNNNAYQWPLWIMSRCIYNKNVSYPNIMTDYEISNTPGVIGELTNTIIPVHFSKEIANTGVFVDDPISYVFKIPNDDAIVWYQSYTLSNDFISHAFGLVIREFGIISRTKDDRLQFRIHYHILNRLGRDIRFAFRDLFNTNLFTSAYTGYKLGEKECNRFVKISSGDIVDFSMYQTDSQTSEPSFAVLDLSVDNEQSLLYKEQQYVVKRAGNSTLFSVNDDNFLVNDWPDSQNQILYKSRRYLRSQDFNYYLQDESRSEACDKARNRFSNLTSQAKNGNDDNVENDENDDQYRYSVIYTAAGTTPEAEAEDEEKVEEKGDEECPQYMQKLKDICAAGTIQAIFTLILITTFLTTFIGLLSYLIKAVWPKKKKVVGKYQEKNKCLIENRLNQKNEENKLKENKLNENQLNENQRPSLIENIENIVFPPLPDIPTRPTRTNKRSSTSTSDYSLEEEEDDEIIYENPRE